MTNALIVMWERQLKEFFRNKQRLMVTLVQPVLFLVAFGFGMGSMYESAGNGNYTQMLIPGIIGMTVLMSSAMSGMSLIWDKQFGFLKETLVAPVSRTELLFGRCLGGATTSTFQGIIILIIGLLMGFKLSNPFAIIGAIFIIFIIALLFNLLGTSLACKFDDMHSFPTIMNFLLMPMIFVSGAFFPTKNFPEILQFVISLNPFTYCLDLLRFGLGAGTFENILLDVIVIGLIICVLGIIGTKLFNEIEP